LPQDHKVPDGFRCSDLHGFWKIGPRRIENVSRLDWAAREALAFFTLLQQAITSGCRAGLGAGTSRNAFV